MVPALHAIDAIAIGIAGAEPSQAYPLLITGTAALVPLSAYALGRSAAGPAAGWAAAILLSWDVTGRGTLESIQQPPAFAFFVLVPVTLALLLAAARSGFDRRTSRPLLLAVAALAIVHATYAVVPLACVAAVVTLTRQGWRLLAASTAATASIFVVIWALALRGGADRPQPPVLSTVFASWGDRPLVAQAAWMFDGRLYVAAAVWAVVPLLLIYRRRHAVAAAVMAGALALCSFPGIPALLTGVFGYGQVKRFPRSGLPWELTAAIVLVELAALLGVRMLIPAAIAIALASLTYGAIDAEGTAATVLVAAIAVAAVAVIAAIAVRRLPVRLHPAAPAAIGAVALMAVGSLAGPVRAERTALTDALRHGPAVERSLPQVPASVIDWCRANDDGFPVVLAEAYIGYQLAGECDVYPVALPQERTRGEPRNAPAARGRAVNIALSRGATAALRARILQRYHVRYLVTNADTTPHAAQALAGDEHLHAVLRRGPWTVYEVTATA